ncbi:hypothetical protein KR032_009687 [Drosophila birchii]|nr:hypothetical protein KR032_009687 [Drosophila birchii]
MKHLLSALVTLLTILPREQDLVLAKGIPCPRRYLRRINGKCYYFSVTQENWFGALNYCLRKGLTLADLSNAQDFDGAVNFLSSLGHTEDFWFGGNDLYHEGRFQYISNGRLVRYYSNYSNIQPSDNSECDDCLEVRIRGHLSMVAVDNCHDHQYFICSERYCQGGAEEAKKPKHHSHEHLHHFHHDIGDSDEKGSGADSRTNNNMLPIASGSQEDDNDSEVAVEAAGLPEAEKTADNSTTTAEGEATATTAAAGEAGAAGEPGAAGEAGAAGASEDTTNAGETTAATETTPPTEAPKEK